MKHHVAIKFLAILLAVVSLFTLIASAAGIILFTGTNLYEQTPADILDEELRERGAWFASDLAQEYAYQHLGNCPEEILYNVQGGLHYFNQGYYGYVLTDEDGTELETVPWDSYTRHYSYTISGMEYMEMVSIKTESELEPEETYIEDDLVIRDNLPEEGAGITHISVTYENGSSSSYGSDEIIGRLDYQEDGRVAFFPAEQAVWISDTLLVTEISFQGLVEEMGTTVETTVYEIRCPYGVGDFMLGEGNELEFFVSYFFISYPISPSHLPTTTAANTPETTVVYDTYRYRDWETGEMMSMEYVDKPMPTYTVELYLAEGAADQEVYWDLLTQVWIYRNELFYVLGFSVLVFAVMAVYLCCAAGKKPGSTEIKAGGFNRISLDVYGLTAVLGICSICVLVVEAGEYLVRQSPTVLLPFLIFAGCGICLLIVGFCFACAAQFKTPGGYWWRNLLGIRCLALVGSVLMGATNFLSEKAEPVFITLCKKLWAFTVRFCKGIYKIAAFVFTKIFHFLDVTLNRFFLWLGRKFKRFFGMLPLTWQWLLGGVALLGMCVLAWANRGDGWGFVWMMLGFALILYGAYCFGILLEAAKRMNKGDLDTKVDDKLLTGSFQEFAGDLNALADVAVVAAQKQLRSERMKTELITNVSHDIKTPLTSIINYVDLLQMPHSDEEQEAYLEVLSRQSQQLKKLIEDLMEMSKASTGNMTVDIAAINAGEAIHQALGEFADKLEKVNLVPVFRQPEEPIYMKADGRLAWRVMSNILGNAVKYALPGTRLYIDLVELEGKAVISFKNISREELNVSADELLERFDRGDISRNTEGSGLGLNIAQSLMEIQKGQLQLLVDGDLFKVTLVFPAVKE